MEDALRDVSDRFESARRGRLETETGTLLQSARQTAGASSLPEWEQVVYDAMEAVQSEWEHNERELLKELQETAAKYLTEAEGELEEARVRNTQLLQEVADGRRRVRDLEDELRVAREQAEQAVALSTLSIRDEGTGEGGSGDISLREEFERMKQQLMRIQETSLQALRDELKRVKQEAAAREDALIRQLAHLKTELAVARTDGELSEHQRRRLQDAILATEADAPSGTNGATPSGKSSRKNRKSR
ncbi:hypothetical protein CDCA_CDCA10G2937 [Cyanidium caldarium]|uniref:KfrA N-terminal DNA-binding domain-containing protein n=1 Tax=Cyanidium caldarium TaxID=2771 RepID=A0AAV9IX52_CYACA|nr:hypothetical protein CDCA_CDCA10G2937 [Cyanidium caldarium]|eukprot:ctg_1005.g386